MKLILNTLMFLLLIACGEGGKSTVAIDVSSFMLSASDHDVILYAKHSDSKLKISVPVTTGTKILDLPNGNWEFGLIAWDRSGDRFTGPQKCARATASLKGGDAVVDITLTPNCMDGLWAQPQFIDVNQFQPVKFISCTQSDLATSAGSSACSTGGQGTIRFIRVQFIPYYLVRADNINMNTSDGLTSACMDISSANYLKIPTSADAEVALKVLGYGVGNSSCTGAPMKVFDFLRGLEPLSGRVRIFDNIGSNATEVYLGDSPVVFPINASDIIPNNIYEDVSRTINLPYNSALPAISCSVSNLSNVIVTTACNCSAVTQLCQVEIQGSPLHYNGPAEFSFQITDSSLNVSNTAYANFTINPTNDIVVMPNLGNISRPKNTPFSIPFSIADIDDAGGQFDCATRMYAGSYNPAMISSITFTDGTPGTCDANFTLVPGATGFTSVGFFAKDLPEMIPNDFFNLTLTP